MLDFKAFAARYKHEDPTGGAGIKNKKIESFVAPKLEKYELVICEKLRWASQSSQNEVSFNKI